MLLYFYLIFIGTIEFVPSIYSSASRQYSKLSKLLNDVVNVVLFLHTGADLIWNLRFTFLHQK